MTNTLVTVAKCDSHILKVTKSKCKRYVSSTDTEGRQGWKTIWNKTEQVEQHLCPLHAEKHSK